MARSRIIPLDDNEVSRKMAKKAMCDETLKKLLELYYHSSPPKDKHITEIILEIISDLRRQLVHQAGLIAPTDCLGRRRHLKTYLKPQNRSRRLVANPIMQKIAGTAATHEREYVEWGWLGSSMWIAGTALTLIDSESRFEADPTPFPFERLPPELRMQVYYEALRGTVRGGIAFEERVMVTRNRKNIFECRYPRQSAGESKDINTSLLRVNRLVNSEAIPVLYRSHIFDFTREVRNVTPLLRGLPEGARHTLQGISMELRDGSASHFCYPGISFTLGPDNQAAWIKACSSIARNFKIKQLRITINVNIDDEFKSLKWVKALVRVKDLQRLTLTVQQYCYRGHPLLSRGRYTSGELLATDHCFSESLVRFFEYLCEEMVGEGMGGLLAPRAPRRE